MVEKFDPTESPHRRYNPLTDSWILVSPHRTKRPWQGQVEAPSKPDLPVYDPKCYLCPGNERSNGGSNPKYDSTYVSTSLTYTQQLTLRKYFVNDFSAVYPQDVETPAEPHPLIKVRR